MVKIELPPLRERGSDILVLAEHFLQLSGSSKVLDAGASAVLLSHSWPGNVRELKNVIQKASLTVSHQVIQRDDLSFDLPREARFQEASPLEFGFHAAVAQLEKKLLQEALLKAGGNRSKAAELLKMRRQLFYSKLKEHRLDLDVETQRPGGDSQREEL